MSTVTLVFPEFVKPDSLLTTVFFSLFGVIRLHSYGGVIMTGEGLQILTSARHLWLLSSEGS